MKLRCTDPTVLDRCTVNMPSWARSIKRTASESNCAGPNKKGREVVISRPWQSNDSSKSRQALDFTLRPKQACAWRWLGLRRRLRLTLQLWGMLVALRQLLRGLSLHPVTPRGTRLRHARLLALIRGRARIRRLKPRAAFLWRSSVDRFAGSGLLHGIFVHHFWPVECRDWTVAIGDLALIERHHLLAGQHLVFRRRGDRLLLRRLGFRILAGTSLCRSQRRQVAIGGSFEFDGPFGGVDGQGLVAVVDVGAVAINQAAA